MEYRIGDKIKGLELRERIGTGGFGTVYRAYQTTVGREVAIKVILPGYANHPDFVRRFDTEAQLIARLEHMHITPLYDYWRDPNGAYLVMRLLRGGSLQDTIQEGFNDLESAAQLLDQLASALSVAHRNNIIHRDIKPSNILLDEDKNAYLTDFGIAKDLAMVTDRLTESDALIGSPGYLAPEQARMELVTPQTDIYSLGVVLYEILAGEHPFPGLSPVERIFAHLNEPIPQITSLDHDVAKEINSVIGKSTEKNPDKRYRDVLALANAFREAAGLSISKAARSLVELLTPREQEVLKFIIEGKSNRKIAEDLVIEISTVKWYVNQIYRKLNVRSRVQAIVKARELNLIVDEYADLIPSLPIIEKLKPDNPYKGLRAFTAADAQDYFGQERLIKNILSKMAVGGTCERFLALVGPSGSGKSSLVKAGLVPAIWRGEVQGSEKWFIVEMVPGSRPLDELEVALTRIAADQGANIGDHLRRDENGLLRTAGLVLPNDGSELLVVIDQFEEVFNLVEDEGARLFFLKTLCAAVTDKKSRVRIILNLRADFYDRPLHYQKFGELIRNKMETVLPLSAEELERVIARPAELAGLEFEEGLVAKITDDVHYQPGALPLLQYALSELFEVREDRVLTHAGYVKIGGAVGALAKRAEDIYMELNEVGRETVRQMFLRLVTLGEGTEDTRRRVLRTELLAIAMDQDLMDEVIDTYANYRLLSLDNDPDTRTPTVEVAHEAILREWERLREMLDDARDDIRYQRQLATAAQDWAVAAKEASYLLRGTRLERFEIWQKDTRLALTRAEIEYLKFSIALRAKEIEIEKTRKAREVGLEKRAHFVLKMLVGVFLVAALVSSWMAIRSYRAEQEALKHAGIGLAGQARLELYDGMPERTVLLALEALENYPYTWQAEKALFAAVHQNRLTNVLDGHTGWVGAAVWSPDGTQLLTASEDGSARIWDTITWEEVNVLVGHSDEVFSGFWSPDGTRITTASKDGTAVVWDAATGAVLHTLSHSDWIIEANWSPDGALIATGSHDGKAKVWDAVTGIEKLTLEGHEDFVEVARWSQDGSRLATASGDGTARVWNAASGKEILLLSGHTDVVIDVTWSPGGRFLATSSYDGTAKVWDAVSGEEIYTLPGEARGEIRWAIWSPDGNRLLTVERGGNQVNGFAAIWDMATGEKIFLLPGLGDLWFAEWSPDGTRVVVNDETTKTRVWDTTTGSELFVLNRPQTLGIVNWSPNGEQLVTGYEDGTLMLWDATDLELLAFPGQKPNGVDWSPDGTRFLRTELGGTTTIMDSVTGEPDFIFPSVGTAYNGASWSPDGKYIASGHTNGTVRVWDAVTGTELLKVKVYEDEVWDPSWSRDSKRISVTGFDGRAHIFDVETGKHLKSLGNPGYGVMLNAVWSPDNTMIAAGNMKGLVFVWDAQTWEEVHKIDVGEWLMGIDWSPDGTQLVVSGFLNGLAQIYDVETGEVQTSFTGHTAPVIYSQWSPDGARIVTAGEDAVRIWDPETGAEYGFFDVGAWRAIWSPDGLQLLTSGTDGVVRVWRVFPTTENLMDYAKECCVFRSLTDEERTLFGLPSLMDK